MSAAIATIHTLLPTLSHSELLEVITKSAELCGKFIQKKPSVGPVLPVLKPTKKSTVAPIAPIAPIVPIPQEPPKKSFVELLGWGDSDDDEIDTSPEKSNSIQRFYDDLSDNCKEEESDEELKKETVMPHGKKCRDMKKCFTHGQRIRHTVSHKVRTGTYDSSKNIIIYNEIEYDSLTKFATAHVLEEHNPNRATSRDGWKHCTCEINGKWVSTDNLPGK